MEIIRLKHRQVFSSFEEKPRYLCRGMVTRKCRYSERHLWSLRKFYHSVGDAVAEAVIQYVRDQRLQQTRLDVFPTTTKGTS